MQEQNGNGQSVMRSEALANITSQAINLTIKDVFLTSLIIEDLTGEAIINPQVSDLLSFPILILINLSSRCETII